MAMIRGMLACRWAARRIQRYLDADPSAPLDEAEMRRLRAHLAVCARCSGRVAEYQALHEALERWAAGSGPDPRTVARIREHAHHLTGQDPP